MSVRSQQVVKPAKTPHTPGAQRAITGRRGFAGNHTLMRKQSETSDRFGQEASNSNPRHAYACDQHTSGGACVTCSKEKVSNSLQRSPIQCERVSDIPRAAATVPSTATAPRLLVSQPDDYSEREADRVMHEMMRSPIGRISTPITQGTGRQTLSAKPQNGRRGNTREGESNRFVPEVGVSEVSPDVEGKVRSAAGNGRPLPVPLRDFLEPRFGHNLSHVRVHTDQSAASTSQSLHASAFTLGSDIFFNAGQFRPDTATGFGLVAHELTHVAQQRDDGVSRRLIQRAELPYHQLVWADFVAAAPTTARESAGLWSSFKVPTPVLTSSTRDTKRGCKLAQPVGRRRRDTTFQGTGSVDPAQFDSEFKPYMETDRSWLQDRFKNNNYCNGMATQCEADFDQNPNVRPRLGNAVANRKSDCKTSFLRTCLADERAKKASLLKHEQGHFEITRVMSDKARDDVKAKAATLRFSAAGCGHDAAMDAVRAQFQQPQADLTKLGQDWRTFKDQVQDAYDHETTNGSNQRKQTEWEGKITAGLTAYVLPAAPQTAPTQTTPTQPAATPGSTRTSATPAPAPPK